MTITNENGITVITPDKGKCMVSNEISLGVNQPVYLGVGDNPDNWSESEIKREEKIIFDGSQIIQQEPNGSPFIQNGNALTIDTKTYTGGLVYNGDAFQGFKKVEITYTSDVDIPSFKVQLNSFNAKTTMLKACDKPETVVLEFEYASDIRTIDLMVNASAETEVAEKSLKGNIVLEKICFVDDESEVANNV